MSRNLLLNNGFQYKFTSYNHFVFRVGYSYTVTLENTPTNIDGAPTDWGDGTVDYKTSHTYKERGTYEVRTRLLMTMNDMNRTRKMLIKCLNIDKEIIDLENFFANCENLTYVNPNIDTSNVISMKWMFLNCTSLESLDLSKWDFSNVIDMSGMFEQCKKLRILDLHNINTIYF